MAKHLKAIIDGKSYVLVPENEYLEMTNTKTTLHIEDNDINNLVKSIRSEKGLTLKELAKILEISHVQLCRIENGQKPQAATKKKIKERLKLIG